MSRIKSFFLFCFILIAGVAASAASSHSTAPQDQVFLEHQVTDAPQYPGGESALTSYIQSNFRIPAEDIENGTRGKIVVNYVVRRDGSVDCVKVVKGINSALNSQVVKLLQNSEGWTAGRLNGHPVDVQRTFILNVKCR